MIFCCYSYESAQESLKSEMLTAVLRAPVLLATDTGAAVDSRPASLVCFVFICRMPMHGGGHLLSVLCCLMPIILQAPRGSANLKLPMYAPSRRGRDGSIVVGIGGHLHSTPPT